MNFLPPTNLPILEYSSALSPMVQYSILSQDQPITCQYSQILQRRIFHLDRRFNINLHSRRSNAQYISFNSWIMGQEVQLVADASNKGVGSYVVQGKEWKMAKHIGFYSHQYHAAEFYYSTHEQEMLAIIEYIEDQHLQLTGTQFEVLTDHTP